MLPPVFVVTSALPYFWVGLLLILIFSVWTNGWLPTDGNYDTTTCRRLLGPPSSATC